MNLPENEDSREQREALDALPVLVFLERDGNIVFANAEARQVLGFAETDWTPRPIEDVLWGLLPSTAEPQNPLTGMRQGRPFHAIVPAKNGRLLPVEGAYRLLEADRREAIIVAHPGGRERAPRSRLMEDVLASLPEAVAIEHGNHVLYTNPAFTEMFGYTADQAVGGSLSELIVPETRLNEHVTLAKAVDEQGRTGAETVRMNSTGELVDVSLQMAPLLVDTARIGYVYTFRDIRDYKETEAKLQHDAMHDVLTGLPNRALFLDRLSLALSRRVRRPDHTCGILYLDLDRFKEVNDALGHAAGDLVLKSVADRLRSSLRPQDSAARLGGDEFAVLVESILAVGDLEIVAKRVLRELERPFEIFGNFVQSGASVGAAIAGSAHTSCDLLIRDADFAMYRAKQAGGGRCEFFDKHLEVCVSSQQERERELRTVLDKRLFQFRYEPIYHLASGKLVGFESQLYWRRADGGVESFRDLMSVAEETGFSVALGREALDTVCRQLSAWRDAPQSDLFVSVNLTDRQFYHPDLAAQLKRALAVSGAAPGRLVFEVPETALNSNPDAAVVILQRLVDCEARVAIDEFGSNLAPLNHLTRLPVDMAKLDRRLTASAATTRQQAVLESVVRLGQTLGVQVVAQGVDTPEQLQALRRVGCPFGQGALLSPPLEPAHALQLAEAGDWTAPPK